MKIDLIGESKTILIHESLMRRSLEETLNEMPTLKTCFINENGRTVGGELAKLFIDPYTDEHIDIVRCIYYHPDYIQEGL